MPSLPPLAELKPPRRAWGCRAAPAGWQGPAQLQAPTFRIAPEALFRVWLALVTSEPRIELLASDERALRCLHVQRTPTLRLPDLIRAEVAAFGPGLAGLVVDSRARYGLFDLGVNRRRVHRWLRALEQTVARP